MTTPFAPGTVSLRLYPHLDLDAPAIVEEVRAQATLAGAHGFDGVMTSEHHGGFAGYLPNPLQAAGFALDAMRAGWAAPCPLLLPLRPAVPLGIGALQVTTVLLLLGAGLTWRRLTVRRLALQAQPEDRGLAAAEDLFER